MGTYHQPLDAYEDYIARKRASEAGREEATIVIPAPERKRAAHPKLLVAFWLLTPLWLAIGVAAFFGTLIGGVVFAALWWWAWETLRSGTGNTSHGPTQNQLLLDIRDRH